MLVSTAEGSWVIPPERAVWMPAGVAHEIRMAGTVAMRTLYVRADAAARLPREARVLAVSPLLRELILRACDLPTGRPAAPRERAQPEQHERARRARHEVLPANVGSGRTLAKWAGQAGALSRTRARLFRKETGLTFVAWRQQARLLAATVMLAAGVPVTRVALDVGYDSPSAFTAMFRRALGAPPSRYVARELTPVRRPRSAAG